MSLLLKWVLLSVNRQTHTWDRSESTGSWLVSQFCHVLLFRQVISVKCKLSSAEINRSYSQNINKQQEPQQANGWVGRNPEDRVPQSRLLWGPARRSGKVHWWWWEKMSPPAPSSHHPGTVTDPCSLQSLTVTVPGSGSVRRGKPVKRPQSRSQMFGPSLPLV